MVNGKKVKMGVALLAAAGVVAGLAVLWPRGAPPEQGERFAYDLEALKQVDPARMIGRELAPIPAQVNAPHALAVDAANRIYVGGETEIAWLEPDGRLVLKFPAPAPVTCMTVDRDGTLLVGARDRIFALGPDGATRAEWTSLGANAVLTSLAATASDVFAADAGQRLVWRFDREGRLLGRIGEKDPERNFPGFFVPSPSFDLAIGPGGALWVVDPGRHRFIEFSPDGVPQSSWQREGMDLEGFSGCCNPGHIAIRQDGSFVTSEKGLVRIKIHAVTGALMGVLAGPDRFAEDTRGIDLAVDGNGRILALDPVRAVILVFTMEAP